MVEVKKEPVGVLEILLTAPRMSGYAGPEWPRTCTIHVAIAGEVVGSQTLPYEFDREVLKAWRLGIRTTVESNWPELSLEIFVERTDFLFRRRTSRVPVVIRDGPHTSGHTAVVGRARVRLLDALVLGDMDDDDDEEKKMKKRRNEVVDGNNNPRLLEGTMSFGKVVKLQDRELPALGDECGYPRSVVRGTVDVQINLRPPFFR